MNDYYNGMPIKICSDGIITKEVQCKTHKKHRTNKKWLKRYGTKPVPDHNTMFVVDKNILVMDETCYKKLKEKLKGER